MRRLGRRKVETAGPAPTPCTCDYGPTRWGRSGHGAADTCFVCGGDAPGPVRVASILPPLSTDTDVQRYIAAQRDDVRKLAAATAIPVQLWPFPLRCAGCGRYIPSEHHRWNCALTPIWAQTIRDLDINPWTAVIKDRSTIHRFGLDLTPESFDRLGESLDRIAEAESKAWREL